MDYPKRKREMIELLTVKRWTLQEIGDKYGITKQRAGQILSGYKRGKTGKVGTK
jgi:DNA-directed RNA polymerase sigma subunit (sigma70/sigma32)